MLLKRKVKEMIAAEDSAQTADGRPAGRRSAEAGHPGDAAHGGEVSRGHADPVDAPKARAVEPPFLLYGKFLLRR